MKCSKSNLNAISNFFIKSQIHIYKNTQKVESDFLRKPSQIVSFPLDPDMKKLIQLIRKLSARDDFAGIAAPQLGYLYQIIAFKIDPEVTLFEHDTSPLPLTMFINPEYTPIKNTGVNLDWESCYSVPELVAEVYRYNQIKYVAYDENGEKKEGIAKGYLARIIQHETDHLKGKLMIDDKSKLRRVGSRQKYDAVIQDELMVKYNVKNSKKKQ